MKKLFCALQAYSVTALDNTGGPIQTNTSNTPNAGPGPQASFAIENCTKMHHELARVNFLWRGDVYIPTSIMWPSATRFHPYTVFNLNSLYNAPWPQIVKTWLRPSILTQTNVDGFAKRPRRLIDKLWSSAFCRTVMHSSLSVGSCPGGTSRRDATVRL